MEIQQRNNSVIFKDPDDSDNIQDLTYVGTLEIEDTSVTVTQNSHFFAIGDVICYNLSKLEYQRALAINTVNSEVCGVVKDVVDNNTFILTTKGTINNTKYNYPNGSTLWLSEVNPGYLTSIAPTNVFRKIAIQVSSGVIEVNLERGFATGLNTYPSSSLEPYTKEELDEIITNINSM